MKAILYLLIVVVSVVATACKSEPAAPESEISKPEPLSRVLPSVSTDSVKPPPRPVPPVTEAEARALLDAWLAAQNDGDFATYGGLYAERFDGVKRAGNRTSRFNRAQWLDDRGKMFRRKMTVAVDTVAIHPMRTAAMIRFNQRWTGGRFSDYGPKEILAVRENGALRIAREEMLWSEEQPSPGAERGEWARFFPVLFGRYAVVEAAPAAVGRGAKPLGRDSATAPVPRSQQSDALKAMVGKVFTTGLSNGSSARRTAVRPVYVAAYISHFGTVQNWQEQQLSDGEIAAEIWGAARASGSVYLALDLGEGPAETLWAAAPPAEPEVYTVLKAEGAKGGMCARVIAAAERTPAFQRIQEGFAADGNEGSWSAYGARIACRRFKGKGGIFFSLSISAGMGCADFFGAFHGLFREKNGTLRYLGYPENFAVPDFVDDHSAYLAVDIDNDGFPEFIGDGKIIYRDGGAWHLFETPVPFGDCPC